MTFEAFQDLKGHHNWRIGIKMKDGNHIYHVGDPVYNNEDEAKTAADRVNKSLENNQVWN